MPWTSELPTLTTITIKGDLLKSQNSLLQILHYSHTSPLHRQVNERINTHLSPSIFLAAASLLHAFPTSTNCSHTHSLALSVPLSLYGLDWHAVMLLHSEVQRQEVCNMGRVYPQLSILLSAQKLYILIFSQYFIFNISSSLQLWPKFHIIWTK